ncbi:MAG: hypothetical protein JW785_03350 [Acidimicrobiia bacterium]|nr:hypothetical protein [Acidimicrobiia bacterium]
MRRLAPFLMALALAAGACAYESSGTTTTTVVDPADVPPATGPGELGFEDQLIEGSAVIVASVTMPSAGFIVLQSDASGTPGEILGVSNLIGRGTVTGVVVPLFFPLEAAATMHATLHVDMDGDGLFRYEPPDDFIDLPATRAGGGPATAVAAVDLLPPLAPASISFLDQRTDGAAVVVAEVSLPGPGFVALHADEDGVPGAILGASAVLDEGTTEEVAITLDRPLETTQQMFAVAYVDRDRDGVAGLTSPDSLDDVAQGPDGGPARAAAVVTLVRLSPAEVEVEDQEGDGTVVTVASVTLPSAGFLELRADEGGSPGRVLLVSGLLPAGTSTGIDFALDPALDADAAFWVRLRIDFDGGGELDDDDPIAMTEGGRRAQASFAFTFVEDEDGD